MLFIKVYFENGDTIITRINGTPEQVARYYLGVPAVLSEDFETGKEERAAAYKVEFLDNCATYENFGCVWALDCYYMPSKDEIKKLELVCNVRFMAHVIKSCETYKGLPTMEAGAFSVYDGRIKQ